MAARDESDRIIGEARELARQMRLEAEDYVDAKLAQYEIALERTANDLQKSLVQVQRGRDKLRGVTVVQEELAAEEFEEENA
jgi:hypothetical protein